jgi:hypothetical protein
MHDQDGQQVLLDVVAPIHAPDVINTLEEARYYVSAVRDDLAERDTPGIPGIVTELDKAMGILVACEALMLAIARRDGMDQRGTVGDVVRNELADAALRMGAARE